ncbi:MAG: Cellulase M-related protein [Thermoleophilia bacterium]|nr:Cellulase M-related protein [Thermoleophilia bacterium]
MSNFHTGTADSGTSDNTDDDAKDERALPYYSGDVRIEHAALDFLLELLDTPAPSGFEEPAAELVERYAAEWADDIHTDGIGNVHVTVNRGAKHRVLVTGHIDEIGFVVTRIDGKGLLRFEQVGGWDLSIPPGQRVRVVTRDGVLVGTVGKLAPHQIKDRNKSTQLKDLWVDIGAATADEAKALVRIGDPIVIDTKPHMFGNRRIMSRSVDDRIGAFIALEVARRAKGSDVEVIALCATREEIGCIGALPGAYGADPDEAIAIDVTWTSDVPGDHQADADVGKGPVVAFGAATRSRISRELVDIAHDAGIDVQINASGRYTGTDGDVVARAGRGIPVGVVSVPTRYLHSPGELFALEDAEAGIDLIHRWVTRER